MKISQIIAVVLVLTGMILAVLASAIPAMLPMETFWTEEQAREHANAAARLHSSTHQAAHATTGDSEADRIQTQQQLETDTLRFDQSKEALAKAQFWRESMPRYLRWIGGAIALVGIGVYYTTRE